MARDPAHSINCECPLCCPSIKQIMSALKDKMRIATPLANEASKPAPSVEQDERVAFEQYLRDKKFPVLPVWKDGRPYRSYTLEKMWDTWIKARAASTSANVAQLDMSLEARLTDAEADVKRLHAEKMELWNQVHGYSANVAQGSEAVAWFTDDSQSDKSATTWDRNVAERWRTKGWPVSPLYAAPPAQTTLTDDAFLSALRELVRLRDKRDAFHKGEGTWTGDDEDQAIAAFELARRALTAVQSASGEKI